MIDYQIIVISFLGTLLLSIAVVFLIESAIRKHKAKKEYFETLIEENKHLKDKIYRLRFNAELRGLKIDD